MISELQQVKGKDVPVHVMKVI